MENARTSSMQNVRILMINSTKKTIDPVWFRSNFQKSNERGSDTETKYKYSKASQFRKFMQIACLKRSKNFTGN